MWTIFKAMISLLFYVLIFWAWTRGSLAPAPGVKLTPPALEVQEGKVLTAGAPGKSLTQPGKPFLQNTSQAHRSVLWLVFGLSCILFHAHCAYCIYCVSFCIWHVFSALKFYFGKYEDFSFCFCCCSRDTFIFTLFKVLSIPLSRAFYSPITVWPVFIGISTQ